MHAPERADRSVDARDLHRDVAKQFLATACAAVTLKTAPAEPEFLKRRQQFERKRIIRPVFVDDRLNLRLHVRPDLCNDRLLLRSEKLDQLVEVAIRSG